MTHMFNVKTSRINHEQLQSRVCSKFEAHYLSVHIRKLRPSINYTGHPQIY